MSAEESQGLSKSAKRRAAQKRAKENGAEEEEAPAPAPAPEPAPKAKSKAKAKAEPKAEPAPPAPEPKAKAKAKAKAEPKAEPKPEPKAEPKAKAKGKAKAEPKAEAKPVPEPKAEPKPKAEAKAEPTAKAKAKAKAKAAAKQEEEEPKKRDPSPDPFTQLDDGSGGAWDVCTGVTKKQQKRKDRVEEQKAESKAAGVKYGQAIQYIPGMGPEVKGKAAPAVSQAVGASKEQIAATAAAAASAAAQAAGAAALAAEKEKEGNSSTTTIKVPEQKIGIVIGPKGAKIKMIQEKTGARIDTSGDNFTITGPPKGVAQAETAVKELIEKGYTSLEYDDFAENFVAVHPSVFPDLIGKQGCVIRKIKDELGVAVNIPQDVPKNASAGKKYKVTLAGSNAGVEKAKDVINDIVMYYHHPLTHPDQVHEEVEVAEWLYRFLIGKAGSELKHIQNNYKVRLYIPRDHSVNQNVVVVGEQPGVERAKTYVEKLLWNAEHAPRGREKSDKPDDMWGEEEEEEGWMKDYLYKR